jgi:lysophospholipase L1-like esterase/pimeloyl-ACP methyl ester carboxylesterase
MFSFFLQVNSQELETAWDNTLDKKWPDDFTQVDIKASIDGKIQKAVFYRTPFSKPQPLIVSLHTWSGNYLQQDPLAKEIVLRGWNYIHPDFRGPNNNPDACGSEQVVSDIEDAIRFAIQNGNVDTAEVHIIGVSGGGYATLVAFMKLGYPVKSFSAWAPITNLEDWYWETTERKLKYARDLENVTTGGAGFDVGEARKRSPVLMEFSAEKRKNASLFIYTGIHDGYTGSVPVTHSINMFNTLVQQFSPDNNNIIVPDSLKLTLLEKRLNLMPDTNIALGGRKIHLYRNLPNISLTIFEGTHEMIVPQALALLPVYKSAIAKELNILTVGDSNGAAINGWPVQLRKLLPYSIVINQSVPGNTIGFNNLNNFKLNTLQNMQNYLDSTFRCLTSEKELNYIILGLGTNDAKRVFEKRQNEVSKNFDSLIELTKEYFRANKQPIPKIVIVSPPPMNEEIVNVEKYGGGNNRIDKNHLKFKKVAKKHDALFIDVNTILKKSQKEFTIDGVHLTSEAQFQVANEICNILSNMN